MTIDQSRIRSFITCAQCHTEGHSPRIWTGFTDEWTIRVWCPRHRKLVADFTLATKRQLRCDVCGEQITEGHRH
jgi:hypothetical protein